MRRSARSMAAGKASALEDLARRKATGESRVHDYEMQEEAPLYDEVDERTYAEIAALKRRDAREFLVKDRPKRTEEDEEEDDDDDNEYYDELEEEFAYEDELSMMEHVENRKRKRGGHKGPRRKGPTPLAKPVKRVAPAFLNAIDKASRKEKVVRDEKPLFDMSELDKEFELERQNRIGTRKKSKMGEGAVDLFGSRKEERLKFDGVEAPPVDRSRGIDLFAPIEPEYDELPPGDGKQESDTKKADAGKADEDMIDEAALIAAADEAIAKRETPVKLKPVPIVKTTPMPELPEMDDPVPAVPRPLKIQQLKPDVSKPAVATNGPLARARNGDLFVFWTDAQDVRVNGGEYLYLFGKSPVGTLDSGVFASVCIQVRGLERKLYVLPRVVKPDRTTPVKIIPDVFNEVKDRLLGKVNKSLMGLGGAAAHAAASNLPSEMKAKIVKRASPFCDSDAPREPTDYLKIKIPYEKACKLSTDSCGENFLRVYGTKTGAAEALALKRGLKGPGWIRVSDAVPLRSRVSHAKHSLVVQSPQNVSVAMDWVNRPPPALSMLAISTKTVLHPKTGVHEIVMVAGVFVKEVPLVGAVDPSALEHGSTKDFLLMRAPDGVNVPFGFRDRASSILAGGGVEVLPNEAAILSNLLTKLLRLDPDVLLQHDLMGFGLDVLLARMQHRKSRDWSRLGRLVQARGLSSAVRNGSTSAWFKEDAVAGRLAVDTLAAAKEFLMGEKDYSLVALSHNVLAAAVPPGPALEQRRKNIALNTPTDVTKVPECFERADTLCRLVAECTHEARTAGRLAAHLNVLPLTKQLTCISGNFWSRTLRGARAERIEFLLSHELKLIGSKKAGDSAKAGGITTKLLLPDKLTKSERIKLSEVVGRRNRVKEEKKPNGVTPGSSSKKKSARRKPQYSGGLVLEPKKGLYDRYVLQLDFNSLYPSIIQEFNICFTTLNLKKEDMKKESESVEDMDELDATAVASKPLVAPGRSCLEGVLPRVLRRLIEQRRNVKKELKQERAKHGRETLRVQQLDTRQLAIKLTANSLYGCLGFEGSRFYARPLAELVTLQGRETLQKTVELSRDEFNAEVIYGDTDSIFVNTGLDDIASVKRMGTELKREVNKRYHTLEIEIDAIYRKMLLLKKKKYAALKVVDPAKPHITVREVKGLDLVRHDWCDLSHDASEHFLSQIFKASSANVDDAVGNILAFLTDLRERVTRNQVILAKYVITRSLTKRPDDYPDGKNLPHVQVALRLRDTLKRRIEAGTYIKYVVCNKASDTGPSNAGVADRAYHPDEVMASKGELVIDVKYYLENQVLPPIMRLAEPIESVERSRLAVALGLDGRRYERQAHENHDETLALGMAAQEADKYRDVERLEVKCSACGAKKEFEGCVFAPKARGVLKSGLECKACGKRLKMAAIANAVAGSVREWMSKYYCSPYKISGAELGMRSKITRNIGLGGVVATRQWDEAWLYTQLRYLHFLMDLEARWQRAAKSSNVDTEKVRMPVSAIDQQVYKALMDRVDKVFDRNAFRFVDIADFLAPLGITAE